MGFFDRMYYVNRIEKANRKISDLEASNQQILEELKFSNLTKSEKKEFRRRQEEEMARRHEAWAEAARLAEQRAEEERIAKENRVVPTGLLIGALLVIGVPVFIVMSILSELG
jgi:hypothetical protein